MLVNADTGGLADYYGGADTVTCLAFAYVDELIGFTKANSRVYRLHSNYTVTITGLEG